MAAPVSLKGIVRMLAAIAPFAAAAIAALGARHDYRILWMAIVATIVAQLTHRAASTRMSRTWPLVALLSTAGASITALLAGAHDAIGVGAVAVVIAAFVTVGAAAD